MDLARAWPAFMYATAGVHPHDAAAFDPVRDITAIREMCAGGAVAIGECGLDYHYDNSPRVQQRAAFEAQLALAAELGKPVVVHTRDAHADTASMVSDAGRAGIIGVLHCFTGDAALAGTAIEAGWFVSFAGVVTFRKWDGDALIRDVPPDRLLAETDAPYLAPVPHRGKRNEPAYAARTVEHLATARSSTPEEIGNLVTANAERLFGFSAQPLARE
jgi:TatD DNase family protein